MSKWIRYIMDITEDWWRCEEPFTVIDACLLVTDRVKSHLHKESDYKANGARGSLACPSCKTGTINYKIIPGKGRLRATCSTKDCLKIIE